MFEIVSVLTPVVRSFSPTISVVVVTFIVSFFVWVIRINSVLGICVILLLIWVLKIFGSIFRVEVSFFIWVVGVGSVASFVAELEICLLLSLSWLFEGFSVLLIRSELSSIIVDGGI